MVLIVFSLETSTSTGLMRKVTSAGPVLIGGVALVEPIGICIELCAAARFGRIKLPPATALATRNCRRDKRCSSCSLMVTRSLLEPLTLSQVRQFILAINDANH